MGGRRRSGIIGCYEHEYIVEIQQLVCINSVYQGELVSKYAEYSSALHGSSCGVSTCERIVTGRTSCPRNAR